MNTPPPPAAVLFLLALVLLAPFVYVVYFCWREIWRIHSWRFRRRRFPVRAYFRVQVPVHFNPQEGVSMANVGPVTMRVDQALPVVYSPVDDAGQPVPVAGPPRFAWDVSFDGAIVKVVAHPLDPNTFFLVSVDGKTTGHFAGTVTGVANASVVPGEPERDVTAVQLIDLTITPDEATSANFSVGQLIEASAIPQAPPPSVEATPPMPPAPPAAPTE